MDKAKTVLGMHIALKQKIDIVERKVKQMTMLSLDYSTYDFGSLLPKITMFERGIIHG